MRSSFRRRVIAEWRGWDEPTDPGRNLHDLGEELRAWLAEEQEFRYIGEEKLKAAWADAVGGFLAGQTEPVSLRHGLLTIRVMQPAVRYALEQGMRNELLKKLQKALGAELIQSLAFTV